MAEYPVRIPFDQLRTALDVALQHAEARHGKTATLELDYYWDISREDLYDPMKDPEPGLGQLVDTWEWTSRLPDEPDDVIGHHLVWLGDILRAIGHTTP
ncbi:hypothetical protein ACIQU6_05115 [Streptomyces sp. NPDC090442]|uniref:hypothetical protein n=1 Tax=Streptomyces sp. NPDC090442 TaxID=3365962 RepID=UPI00382844B8